MTFLAEIEKLLSEIQASMQFSQDLQKEAEEQLDLLIDAHI